MNFVGMDDVYLQQKKIRSLIDSGVTKFVFSHTINGDGHTFAKIGDVVELVQDDGSVILQFKLPDGYYGWMDISRLEPAQESLMDLQTQLDTALARIAELEEALKDQKDAWSDYRDSSTDEFSIGFANQAISLINKHL